MESILKTKKDKSVKIFSFVMMFSMFFFLFTPITVQAQDAPRAVVVPETVESVNTNFILDNNLGNSQAAGQLQGFNPAQQQGIAQAGGAITGGVAQCAVGQLLGEGVKQYLSSAVTNLFGSALEREVPVKPVKQDQKEVATTIGNVPVFPSWDSIAFCLVNSIIDHIGRSTVNWINSGFQGNPVFVDDAGQFFSDIADIEAGGFIQGLGGGFLCEQFDVEIRLALLREQTNLYSGRHGFGQCRLSEVVQNVDSFVQGNFEEGGWTGWFELTQNPANNPYGSQYYATQAMRNRISARQNVARIELGWGSGFLNFKDPETGKTTTPGRLIEQQINNRLDNPEQRLLLADEFDEIINALVNQLVKIALDQVTSLGN